MRILRGLTSRLLPCGCIAGVYETYDGVVVTLLDERGAACHEFSHVAGDEVPELATIHRGSSTTRQPDRQSKP